MFDGPAWSASIARQLGELDVVHGGDPTLQNALLSAREAMHAWQDRFELAQRRQRARDDAQEQERRARERVVLILDCVTRLAELSRPATPTDRRPSSGPPAAAGGLRAHLLGRFQLCSGGRQVTDWRGRRGSHVLQFLLGRRGASVDREALIDALWPGLSLDAGRHRLHQAVYALRQSLHQVDPGNESIVFANGACRLDPAVTVWTDVDEFDRLAAAGPRHESEGRPDHALDAYRRAAELYRGDYLEDNPDAEWAAADRQRLRGSFVVISNRLGELHAERGDHAATLAACARVLERDAWNEEATCRAMRSYSATGNRTLALQLFQSFGAELDRQLGIVPSARARRLYAKILTPTGSLPSIR